MRTFGIVPEEMLHEFGVEDGRIEKFGFVKVNKLFLNGSIKAFSVGIHFRHLRIGMPMDLVQAPDFSVEVLHELRTVVGEDVLELEGKQKGYEIEEFFGYETGMACRRPSE